MIQKVMDAAVGMNVQRRVNNSHEVGRSGKDGRRKGAGCSITTGTMYIRKEVGRCRQSCMENQCIF